MESKNQLSLVKIDSLKQRIAVSALSSLAFFALSVTVGFSLVIPNMHYFGEFRIVLFIVSLLFALPFGLCVYVTRLSLLSFPAFGFVFLLSYSIGIPMPITILYSVFGCLCTALLLTASKAIKKIISSRSVNP
jgi:hypothetical protein